MDADTAVDTEVPVDLDAILFFIQIERRTLKIIQAILTAITVRGYLNLNRIFPAHIRIADQAGMPGNDNRYASFRLLSIFPRFFQQLY